MHLTVLAESQLWRDAGSTKRLSGSSLWWSVIRGPQVVLESFAQYWAEQNDSLAKKLGRFGKLHFMKRGRPY
jgi:hypothetical protein